MFDNFVAHAQLEDEQTEDSDRRTLVSN